MTENKKKLIRYFRDLHDAGRFDRLDNGVAEFDIDGETRRHFPELDRIGLVRAGFGPDGFEVALYRESEAEAKKAGLATGLFGKSEASTTIHASPAIVAQRRDPASAV